MNEHVALGVVYRAAMYGLLSMGVRRSGIGLPPAKLGFVHKLWVGGHPRCTNMSLWVAVYRAAMYGLFSTGVRRSGIGLPPAKLGFVREL